MHGSTSRLLSSVPSFRPVRISGPWTANTGPNAWLYSADVIIPVVEFGQKKAWQPANNVSIELRTLGRLETPNLVYYVQLTETVLGWMGALLLVSFVGGLIKKE
jgi:hypothetical protein